MEKFLKTLLVTGQVKVFVEQVNTVIDYQYNTLIST